MVSSSHEPPTSIYISFNSESCFPSARESLHSLSDSINWCIITFPDLSGDLSFSSILHFLSLPIINIIFCVRAEPAASLAANAIAQILWLGRNGWWIRGVIAELCFQTHIWFIERAVSQLVCTWMMSDKASVGLLTLCVWVCKPKDCIAIVVLPHWSTYTFKPPTQTYHTL